VTKFISTIPAHTSENPVFLESDPFFELAREIDELIAQRAYELFESDGGIHGRDREHWLAAQSETLVNVPVNLSETETELTITADVPGFKDKDLEVRVAPRSVCITGEREIQSEKKDGATIYNERLSNRVFRTIGLNSEVDTEKVKATLADGVLEIKLLKVAAGKKVQVLTKTAGA